MLASSCAIRCLLKLRPSDWSLSCWCGAAAIVAAAGAELSVFTCTNTTATDEQPPKAAQGSDQKHTLVSVWEEQELKQGVCCLLATTQLLIHTVNSYGILSSTVVHTAQSIVLEHTTVACCQCGRKQGERVCVVPCTLCVSTSSLWCCRLMPVLLALAIMLTQHSAQHALH